MFVFHSLVLILNTVFGQNFPQYTREVEAMFLYSLNVFKGVLLSQNLCDVHFQLRLPNLMKLFVRLVQEKKGKVKEKLSTIVMSFIE